LFDGAPTTEQLKLLVPSGVSEFNHNNQSNMTRERIYLQTWKIKSNRLPINLTGSKIRVDALNPYLLTAVMLILIGRASGVIESLVSLVGTDKVTKPEVLTTVADSQEREKFELGPVTDMKYVILMKIIT
jgi:hypothetical protein